MNRNFFLWYYGEGLKGAFAFFRTLLRYIAFRFHLAVLLRTLVSPWKRDISRPRERGLHPVRMLERLFDNFISRFLGMIVRMGVLAFGGVLFLVTFLFGLGYPLFHAGVPFLLITGLGLLVRSPIWGTILMIVSILTLILASLRYSSRQVAEPETWESSYLADQEWFGRVLDRLALARGEFDSQTFARLEQFLEFLSNRGIEKATFERAFLIERMAYLKAQAKKGRFSWENLKKSRPVGKFWNFAYTPRLDRYSLDLTAYDPSPYRTWELVGREEEFKMMVLILERPSENNVLLTGDIGVGKKMFVHYLARLIRENYFLGSSLDTVRILKFDLGQALSDAQGRHEDPEMAIRELFYDAARGGNIILFIEDLDTYLGNDPTHQSIAPLLAEYLAYPTFRVIGTMTPGRYRALAEIDEPALKYFEMVNVRETTIDETIKILAERFGPAENKGVIFTIKGLEAIVRAAERYNWESPFPERALDLAQEVFTHWQGIKEPRITPEVVNSFVTMKTGVPIGAIGSEEKEKLLNLEAILHKRVVGQEEAVKQVAEAIRKARAGIGNDKKPLGSFLFMGPTGVGKTETAKALAESYFGNEEHMIRLDMSEYQTPQSVIRLIGSREENLQGELVTAAKDHPFTLLLLDEVEKAYPKVLDLFLQILDEGFVTDGYGDRVSFRNMVIVATSNAGAPLIQELFAAGKTVNEVRESVLDMVVKEGIFRLEFLGRFDGVIFFAPLADAELVQVTELRLGELAARLKKEKNITLSFGPGVAEKIIANGLERQFGARSINRYIEEKVEDQIVKKIIAGDIREGGSVMIGTEDF